MLLQDFIELHTTLRGPLVGRFVNIASRYPQEPVAVMAEMVERAIETDILAPRTDLAAENYRIHNRALRAELDDLRKRYQKLRADPNAVSLLLEPGAKQKLVAYAAAHSRGNLVLLLVSLLETIANDNLFNAVLDTD